LIITFFSVGGPFANYLFRCVWAVHYQGAAISGEAFGEIMVTLLYVIMSIIAWIIGLIRTILANVSEKRG